MPEWDADESISTDDDDDEDEVVSGDNDENEIDRDGIVNEEFKKDDFRRRNGWKVRLSRFMVLLLWNGQHLNKYHKNSKLVVGNACPNFYDVGRAPISVTPPNILQLEYHITL